MVIKNPVVLVTGGCGNIASYVVEQAFADLDAEKVIIVDNFYNSSVNRIDEIWENVYKGPYGTNVHTPSILQKKERLILEEIDIGDCESLLRAFRKHKPDYVFHLASSLTLDSKKFPRLAVQTNILGTQHFYQFPYYPKGIPFSVLLDILIPHYKRYPEEMDMKQFQFYSHLM